MVNCCRKISKELVKAKLSYSRTMVLLVYRCHEVKVPKFWIRKQNIVKIKMEPPFIKFNNVKKCQMIPSKQTYVIV